MGIGGPAASIDTACSSSLVAANHARAWVMEDVTDSAFTCSGSAADDDSPPLGFDHQPVGEWGSPSNCVKVYHELMTSILDHETLGQEGNEPYDM